MLRSIGRFFGAAVREFNIGYCQGRNPAPVAQETIPVKHVAPYCEQIEKEEADRLEYRILNALGGCEATIPSSVYIDAIKLHRTLTGSDLKTAVDYVKELMDRYNIRKKTY